MIGERLMFKIIMPVYNAEKYLEKSGRQYNKPNIII